MAIFDGIVGYLGFKVLWPRVRDHFHSDIEEVSHGHHPHDVHGETK